MEKELLYEKIERYLEGIMTGIELNEFEQELKSNPELASELELHKELQIAITDEKSIEFEKKMTAAFQETKEENISDTNDLNTAQNSNRSYSIRHYIAMAASILLLIIASVFIYQNPFSSDQSFTALVDTTADYPTSIEDDIYNTERIRDNSSEEQNKKLQDEIKENWSEVMRAYANKDFEQTKVLLQELTSFQTYLNQAYFFYVKGITQLQLGEAEEAYITLSNSKFQTEESQNSVKWYRAIAALMMNSDRETEIGIELLEELAVGNSAYQESANKLLKKYNNE